MKPLLERVLAKRGILKAQGGGHLPMCDQECDRDRPWRWLTEPSFFS